MLLGSEIGRGKVIYKRERALEKGRHGKRGEGETPEDFLAGTTPVKGGSLCTLLRKSQMLRLSFL